mmetsp:Transcript_24695/g.74149  ORF Transcript_24695/g.74149 Transcript_24695/m.74149 type:complete len:175 (+) Transcript_24695:4780-5304(+)
MPLEKHFSSSTGPVNPVIATMGTGAAVPLLLRVSRARISAVASNPSILGIRQSIRISRYLCSSMFRACTGVTTRQDKTVLMLAQGYTSIPAACCSVALSAGKLGNTFCTVFHNFGRAAECCQKAADHQDISLIVLRKKNVRILPFGDKLQGRLPVQFWRAHGGPWELLPKLGSN